MTDLVPADDLASLFNLTARRVQQLAEEGVIPKANRDKYLLWESITGYIKFIQERMAGRKQSADSNDTRTRLLAAQAEKTELEVDEKKGDLIRRETVEMLNKKVAVTLNANLIGIADRVAPLVAASASGAECHHLINDEVRRSLDSSLMALGQIQVDERLMDITRAGAIDALNEHEKNHENFKEPAEK